MKNIYQPIRARIEEIITETPNIKTFIFRTEKEFQFSTGQFVEITVSGIGESPFTPSSSPYETEKFAVTIMKAGYVTGKLHEIKKGELVGIRGPYGKGYPIEEFYNKEVIILGGGVGMAPLRSLMFTLIKQLDKFKRVVLCYGAKTMNDIVYKNLFDELKKKGIEVYQSIDKAEDGWKQKVGVVTTLFDDFKIDVANSVAIVCGPPIMMKFGTLKLKQLGYEDKNIYLSMEKNMSCGLGKCGHCQVGPYFACKDGPVFTYDKIKDIADIWA
jgi:NAD(P)H-flavin reductase